MAYTNWPLLRRLNQSWIWRPNGYWLVVMGVFLLTSSPYFVEKYLVTSLQNDLQKSAGQLTEQLTTRLDTEKKGFHRAVLAAGDTETQFATLSKAWLIGSSDVMAVTLMDHTGQILKSANRSEMELPTQADFMASWASNNQILIAHVLELQEPAFSILQPSPNDSIVNLIIPTGTGSTLLYVVSLDTKIWTAKSDLGEKLTSLEIIPYRSDTTESNGRVYSNSTAWEGLWTLKFQSKDPLFGILQTLRPVFFGATWLIVGMLFLYWKNFRLRQKAELELQNKSQMLEKQNRLSLLGEMSAQLAHEINQPLATIANYAVAGKLQLQSANQSNSLTSIFEEILEQSQRAAQVLIAVRAILQPNPLDMSIVNVDELIQKLEPALRFLCTPHQINLTASSSKHLPVRLNPILFEQVIFNLVKNSIQALIESDRPDKRISISCKEYADRLAIDIEDNGPGIQADNVVKIFDSFFTTKTEGLGIGLSLCRSVIERFNGKLSLKFNSNRGVCFLIDLPIAHIKTEAVV